MGSQPVNRCISVDSTAAGSTAIPLNIMNSLTGSQVLPAASITPLWNTSGSATALLVNPTNTLSGGASLIADFQLGGTSQFKIRKDGLVTAASSYATSAFNTFYGVSGSTRLAIVSSTEADIDAGVVLAIAAKTTEVDLNQPVTMPLAIGRLTPTPWRCPVKRQNSRT